MDVLAARDGRYDFANVLSVFDDGIADLQVD
jgi:hypothetical protein